MQNNNIINIIVQATNPQKLFVMLKKLYRRYFDQEGNHTQEENLKWIKSHSSDFEKLAINLDESLWDETVKVSKNIERNAEYILGNIEYNLGGGAGYPFLYFITRYMQPSCIVETGVAAGFSSYSFLEAIKANQNGMLYSSDFPYFRITNPEKYVGIVVEESLKENWVLLLDGDEKNLPKIIKMINQVDLFHYDSDKSYSGRSYAMQTINKSLGYNGIILMDDIEDNSFYYDYIEQNQPESWSIYEFQGKYIGMIGRI